MQSAFFLNLCAYAPNLLPLILDTQSFHLRCEYLSFYLILFTWKEVEAEKLKYMSGDYQMFETFNLVFIKASISSAHHIDSRDALYQEHWYLETSWAHLKHLFIDHAYIKGRVFRESYLTVIVIHLWTFDAWFSSCLSSLLGLRKTPELPKYLLWATIHFNKY